MSGVVRLIPNVALNGIATQSETHVNTDYAGSPFLASYAIDGNFETVVIPSRGACSITELTPPVWWQVDLLEVYEITKVAITTRKEDSKSFLPIVVLHWLTEPHIQKYVLSYCNLR